MKPDLEMVRVRDDQSFKVWSHGYPFRTVRWHFHPEYELHFVTATQGDRYVGDHVGPFAPGDMVLVGPNLPHNWISDVPGGETVSERCIVLQFTDAFLAACMSALPELRFVEPLLRASRRGARFGPAVAALVGPKLRDLLHASDGARVPLFFEILNALGHAAHVPLATAGFQLDAASCNSTALNLALQHIGQNFTRELNETELARLSRQSVSAFSRSFRRHTGMTFVHYVNALRIELACQHLSLAELPITDICYEVGFRNVSNFNRQFLAAKGMPPSRFRSLQRSGRRLAPAA